MLRVAAWVEVRAFSLAGVCFFPARVLGIFWKRATPAEAVADMLVGSGLTLYSRIGVRSLGIPAGFLTSVLVSLLTRAPDAQTLELVEQIRYPRLPGGAGGQAAVQ